VVLLNKIKLFFKKILFLVFAKTKKAVIRDTINRRIKLEKKRLKISSRFIIIKNIFKQYYLPTKSSTFIIIIFIILLYFFSVFISNLTFPNTPDYLEKFFLLNKESNHYQNIISIHAGIGIVIFALIIFIAESMRESNQKDTARVLLKESFIYPITVIEILVFFTFIFGPINIFSYLIVIGIGFAVIISLGNMIRILLNPILLHKKTMQLFNDRLIQSIDSEIDHRLGNWLLSNFFDKSEIKLKHNPYFGIGKFEFIYFKSDKEGFVYDINLDNLITIGNLIEGEANRNNFYWKRQIKVEGEARIEQSIANTSKEIKRSINNNINEERFLITGYRSFINKDYNFLLAVDANLIKNSGVFIKIEKLLPRTFIIKDKDIIEKEIKYEFSNLKDQFIDAIQKKHLGEIDGLKEKYINIAEFFLSYLKRSNIIHSFKRTQQERSKIFGGWKEAGWLFEDIFDIFEKAMETEDRRIIQEIDHFPISIAKVAISFHDHYLFQEFIRFPEYLYLHAKKVKDPEIKDVIIDSAWRLLKELVEFDLLYKITYKYLPKQELYSYRDFIIYIIFIYQNLIRSTILDNDEKNFNIISGSFKSLFSEYYDFKFSKKFGELKKGIISESRKNKINILDYEENLKSVYSDIDVKNKQLYIGLASWILNEIVSKEKEEYLKFFKEIEKGIPNDLKEVFKIFIETIDENVDYFWGWTHWVLPADGKVHSVNFDYYIYQFFCVKSLKIINMKYISGREVDLPFNRQLSYLAEDRSRLMRVLNDIEKNKDKWSSILNDQEIEKVDVMRIILKEIKNKQDERDIESIINKSISKIKIEEFKKEFTKTFYENASIREILKHYNLYLNKLSTNNTVMPRLGINIIDNKEAFFDQWHIGYQYWGAGYGRDLAFGENLDLFRKIIKSCKKIDIKEFNEKVNSIKNMEEMIIVADIHSVSSFFRGNKNYVPSYHKDCLKKDINQFKGIYRTKKSDIRIYEVFLRDINNILLLNYEKLGKLIQLTPLDKDDDEKNITDIFYISIKAFSENFNTLEKFIKNPPNWLSDIGNTKEQKKYLMQKVLVHIFERYEFNIDSSFEGYLFKTKNSL